MEYRDSMSHMNQIAARIDRLPATRSIWKMVLVLGMGFFFELYDMFYAGYIAQGLVRDGMLKSSSHGFFDTASVASFIAALFVGLFVGTLACGFLADRFGRRALFTWSLLWYTAANVLMALQETAWGLHVWRALTGLGLGVEMVTIGAYIAEWVPRHIRGRAFACVQAMGFVAMPVVAGLAYVLVPLRPMDVSGWRWVVLIGASAGLFVWWMRRSLPESPRWLAQQGRWSEADRAVNDLESRVQKEYGRPLPAPCVVTPFAMQDGSPSMWRPPYRRRTWMLATFNVFQVIGFYGFAHWLPTLLVKQGIEVTTSLLYATLIVLAAPIGPLLGLLIADRFERKTVIIVMAGATLVCGLLFSRMSHAIPLIILGIALTLAANIMSYSYHAYQAELFPTAIRARAIGFVYSWSRLSTIFVPFAIAGTLDNFGVVGVFTLIGAAMAIVMIVIGRLGPRTRAVALEGISRHDDFR